jgi:hypothetical protein
VKSILGKCVSQESVGTGVDPGFNAITTHKKTLTTISFDNTYEADEVSPEVEAGVVAGIRCLQPYIGHIYVILTLN